MEPRDFFVVVGPIRAYRPLAHARHGRTEASAAVESAISESLTGGLLGPPRRARGWIETESIVIAGGAGSGSRQRPGHVHQRNRARVTSVMMDGSLLEDGKTVADYEYNVQVTREVVAYAHARG